MYPIIENHYSNYSHSHNYYNSPEENEKIKEEDEKEKEEARKNIKKKIKDINNYHGFAIFIIIFLLYRIYRIRMCGSFGPCGKKNYYLTDFSVSRSQINKSIEKNNKSIFGSKNDCPTEYPFINHSSFSSCYYSLLFTIISIYSIYTLNNKQRIGVSILNNYMNLVLIIIFIYIWNSFVGGKNYNYSDIKYCDTTFLDSLNMYMKSLIYYIPYYYY